MCMPLDYTEQLDITRMEPVGVRMQPEGHSQSPHELETEAFYTDVTESFYHEEICQSFLNIFSRKPIESSTFTYVTNLSEDFISQDTMATSSLATSSSAGTVYENSSLDLVINRTCDFVASATSSLTFVDTTDDVCSDKETHCVPECSVLTREVIGCEDPDFSVISQLEDSELTVCQTSPEPSSKGSLKESSKPLASSTMIDQISDLSSESSSTRVAEIRQIKPCAVQCSSDPQSIYTWTIYDKSQDTVFDESYVKGHHHIPNIHNTKMLTSSPQPSSRGMYRCDTNCKHVMLEGSCPLTPMDSLSVIEFSDSFRDGHMAIESLYDEDIPVKSNCLPRTSTKVNLHPVENFHQVPNNSEDNSEDIVQERPEPDLPLPKSSKVFKFPKTTTQLKKLFTFRKSKGKNSDKTGPKPYFTETQEKMPEEKKSRDFAQVRDKRAVIKKMKSFSAGVNNEDGSGLSKLQVLANL